MGFTTKCQFLGIFGALLVVRDVANKEPPERLRAPPVPARRVRRKSAQKLSVGGVRVVRDDGARLRTRWLVSLHPTCFLVPQVL